MDKWQRDFVAYWIEEYDWKTQEKQLNRYPQFKCNVDDVDIHFFHIKGKGENPIPIILTHGWPDSFIRYEKVIPPLTNPARFGRNADVCVQVLSLSENKISQIFAVLNPDKLLAFENNSKI